ncbi:MAG: PepSY domain-containing protein [Sphingomonadaceae bacterium]|nr:PepSY domain-containing protein [Sphingomonadaceae bacterium]
MARWASWIHKWLALLMAIQILFWFASGLFFAAVPIETVRSEHRIAVSPPVALDLNASAGQLRALSDQISDSAASIEIRNTMGRPVAIVTMIDDSQSLYDLETAERISPISEERARIIAESHLTGTAPAIAASWVEDESTEYRGALPAWRIDFEQANRAVYVAADTGQVTARRSTLWRTFDFLWSLHIMDFKDHENFNTPLLIGATLLGLVIILTGFIMFPSRLGYNAWRRRRKRRRSS